MQYAIISTALIYSTVSAMTISSLLSIISLLALHSENFSAKNHPSSLPVKLRQVALTVTHTPEHYGLNHTADWASLVPVHGFVRISDESHDLFQLSMYHQIHCLMGYRQYFNRMLAGIEIDDESFRHIDHCSLYLTQLMLCGADTTLEPSWTAVRKASKRRVHVVNTEGTTHRCRDWTQVREWVERNYYRWEAERKHYKGEDLN